MPRGTKKLIAKAPKEMMQAELDGIAALSAWLDAKLGRGAYLSKCTGMHPSSITRMRSGATRITQNEKRCHAHYIGGGDPDRDQHQSRPARRSAVPVDG
jgi:hypothetical protein